MILSRTFLIPVVLLVIALPVLFIAENNGAVFLAKLVIFLSAAIPVTVYLLSETIGLAKAKTLFINILVFGVTTSLCLLVAEIFVRYQYDHVTTTGDNTSYFALRWKRDNPPVTNEYGFRERNISRQKESSVYRIAVIGDSFAYGQGILEEARFSEIIERQLGNNNNRYEVLNFGRPGAEMVDHIHTLYDIFEVNPDFILLQWFSNDVEGADKSERPKPYRLVPSDYLSGWLHKNSALYYLVNTRWNQLQWQLGLIESYEDSMLRRFSDPESVDSRRADRELDEFVTLVKNNNIQTGIVMFPNLVEVDGSADGYPYGFLFDRVHKMCSQHAIQCLDLRPVFAHRSPASELWVNQFDSHPGPIANELAAEAILITFGKQWKSRASLMP